MKDPTPDRMVCSKRFMRRPHVIGLGKYDRCEHCGKSLKELGLMVTALGAIVPARDGQVTCSLTSS